MAKTKIEWADEVWNPVVGCRRVSEGCRRCYAERMAFRLSEMGKAGYVGIATKNGWTGKINTLPEKLFDPLRWKKPRRVFVNSMSDLFHPDVPFFFKQWGEWLPDDQLDPRNKRDPMIETDMTWVRIGKKTAGRLLDGVEYLQFPE